MGRGKRSDLEVEVLTYLTFMVIAIHVTIKSLGLYDSTGIVGN
jgi:hypothetical protein